jgi:hypothetical protein
MWDLFHVNSNISPVSPRLTLKISSRSCIRDQNVSDILCFARSLFWGEARKWSTACQRYYCISNQSCITTTSHYTGRISRSLLSIKKTESQHVRTSRRSCSSLSKTVLGGFPTLNQLLELPSLTISSKASRCLPVDRIARTTPRACSIGLDSEASSPSSRGKVNDVGIAHNSAIHCIEGDITFLKLSLEGLHHSLIICCIIQCEMPNLENNIRNAG